MTRRMMFALYQRRARERDPERYRQHTRNSHRRLGRKYRLKHSYGITSEQWAEKFDTQGRVCASCGSEQPRNKRGWCTDHDHATGKLRDILCHKCNVALGAVEDDIERLELLIKYLKKHQKET